MADGQALPNLNKIAAKWRDFAEKRHLELAEFHRSGRWKRYYSEAEYALRLWEASVAVDVWTKIAPPEPGRTAAAKKTIPEGGKATEPQRGAA